MSEITYVELSQSKSSSIYENGDFKVNLDKPIIIENGDQVALYKSFIDTTLQQTEKIKLTDDLQLSMDFIMYARNWWGKITTPKDLTGDGVFLNGTGPGDNADFMVVNKTENPGQNASILTTIDYGKITFASPYLTGGNFTAVFKYVDINGVNQQTHIKVPKFIGLDTEIRITGLNIRCQNDSFIDITPESVLKKGFCWDTTKNESAATYTYTNAPVSGDFHLSPFIQTVKVVVPKGDYDPNVLAEYITDELTRVDEIEFIGVPQGSPFLNEGTNLGMSIGVPNNGPGAFESSSKLTVFNGGGNGVFFPLSGGRGNGSGVKYIIGASQVALTFQNNSIFTWEFLHTPYYVGAAGTTKSIGLAYLEVDDANQKYQVVNKYGGIAFTSLRANVINDDGSVGEPLDFWEGIMKFDLGSLCVVPEDIPNIVITDSSGKGFSGSSTKLKVELKDSVNTTGGLISIDSTVDKTSDTPFGYTELTPPICNETEIGGTFGIQAVGPYDVNDAYDTPYFRVDIECSVRNKIVGEKTLFNNTFAIVGRYYELNSYNAGTSADSLVYVHKGEPVVMSSLNVRILDNEGKMPVRLGADNTIYLQVVKSQGSIVPRTP